MGIHQQKAYSLLTDNYKLLFISCFRGSNGRDYSQLLEWYRSMGSKIPQLVQLFQVENDNKDLRNQYNPDNIVQALCLLKCGLFSQYLDLVRECTHFICKLAQHI